MQKREVLNTLQSGEFQTDADFAARRDGEPIAEGLGAELTNADYQVTLKYGVEENWLDLELDLWKALSHAVGNKSRSDSTKSNT